MTYNPAHVVLHANHAVTLNGDKLGEWGPLNRPHGYFFLCGGCTATIDRFLKSDLREAILIHVAGPRHGGSVLTSPAPTTTPAPPPINPDLYARSAAEDLLEHAIARLTDLERDATMALVQADDDPATLVYPETGLWKGNMARDEDAEMVTTLWRTPDVLADLLRLALEYGPLPAGRGSRFHAIALDLARAILGEK